MKIDRERFDVSRIEATADAQTSRFYTSTNFVHRRLETI